MSGAPVVMTEPTSLPPDRKGPSLAAALAAIFRDPVGVILVRWNWKAALLSVALRGWIFVVVSVRSGWKEVGGALVTELLYCAATAGFYGALTQAVCDAEPEWLTAVFITFMMPALMQWVEYFVHRQRGTHHLGIVMIVLVAMSAISSLFNWYAMRRGTLLMGERSQSFGRDLASLPRLLGRFFLAGPRWLWSALSHKGARAR